MCVCVYMMKNTYIKSLERHVLWEDSSKKHNTSRMPKKIVDNGGYVHQLGTIIPRWIKHHIECHKYAVMIYKFKVLLMKINQLDQNKTNTLRRPTCRVTQEELEPRTWGKPHHAFKTRTKVLNWLKQKSHVCPSVGKPPKTSSVIQNIPEPPKM